MTHDSLPAGWFPTTFKQNAGTVSNPIRHHYIEGEDRSRCTRARREQNAPAVETPDDSPHNCTRCAKLKARGEQCQDKLSVGVAVYL